MKNSYFKPLLKLVAMSATLVYGGLAQAHIYNGLIVNKTVQVLTLNCPATTAYVEAQVLDLGPNAGIMSVTVFKDGNAKTASDLTQTDGVYGPFASLSAGSGTYYLIASQTAVASGSYRIQYHCRNSGGTETTTTNATLTQP